MGLVSVLSTMSPTQPHSYMVLVLKSQTSLFITLSVENLSRTPRGEEACAIHKIFNTRRINIRLNDLLELSENSLLRSLHKNGPIPIHIYVLGSARALNTNKNRSEKLQGLKAKTGYRKRIQRGKFYDQNIEHKRQIDKSQ